MLSTRITLGDAKNQKHMEKSDRKKESDEL